MKNDMLRRSLAEVIGTFVIVVAPVALSGASSLPGADKSLAASAWVSGLAVLAMVYTLGHISGAHFNPAVTLGFAAARRFPYREIAPYICAQLTGAIAAGAVGMALFGAGHGVHVLAVTPIIGAALEALLTFFLMLVIMAVATERKSHPAVPGLAIGLTVVFDIFIGGAATGGSMNPARTLGPALFGGMSSLSHYWVYLIGPIGGAIIAARAYELLRADKSYDTSALGDELSPSA